MPKDADDLAAYTDLPAPQSHRLIDFEEASVQPGGSSSAQWVLQVRGTAPYPGMHITPEPVVYLQRPAFWRIEVVGRLLEPVPPRPTPYLVQLDLPGPMGTRGIEVAGAGRVAQIVLMEDPEEERPAGPVLLRGLVKDAGGWPLGKVPVVGRSPGREADIDAIVTTDTEGRYTMQLPGPGRYLISTEAAGFADALAEIEVRGALPGRQDFYLTPLPALQDSILEEHPVRETVPGPGPAGDDAEVVEPDGDAEVVEEDSSPAPKRARKAGGTAEPAPRPRARRRNTS
ncbi:hypothetical protein GCM10020358_45330 [Amorphoplanes nipponensis]|uniref:Carboxypeptidase regulatory-like domain-containing protein n=1 Tax=Actinoplanes nipponensis TaxID=135950 RepID=A0A919JMZ1_9ACTN|nr:carboxypeptidase-like regulatory domain-containing protein [Actinoplanes nipponensis]GIE53591.1 hypothetical protein Ani05nite_71250 [Actinoplanes nipponensis]